MCCVSSLSNSPYTFDDVTQDPPPPPNVILRGPRRKKRLPRHGTLCNQQQLHWRWKVASRNCQLPLIFSAKWEERYVHPFSTLPRMQPLRQYSGGRKCKRERRLYTTHQIIFLLWGYFVFNFLSVREFFFFFFFIVETGGVFCKTKTGETNGEKKENWRWLKKRDGAEGVPIFGHGCQTPSSWLFLSSLMIYLYTVITNTSGATEFVPFFFLQPTGLFRLKWRNTNLNLFFFYYYYYSPPSRSFEITAAWDGDCGDDESRWQSSPSVVASISIISS